MSRRRRTSGHRHAQGVQRIRQERPRNGGAPSLEEILAVAFVGDASDPATMAALLSATSLLTTQTMEAIISVQELCGGPDAVEAAWAELDHEGDVLALRAGLTALAGRVDALGAAYVEHERREGEG